MNSSENDSNDNNHKYESITASIRIAALLKPLENKTNILQLILPGNDSPFSSSILKVDSENKLLTLDKLIPAEGNDLLVETGKSTIEISHKGVKIKFDAILNDALHDKVMPRFEFIFPESIQYLLRRNSYRVSIRGGNELNVEVLTDDNKTFSGELHNISTEGMCIKFPVGGELPQVNDLAEVQCSITFSDDQELKCTFKVCHTYIYEKNKEFRIGGTFLYLDKAQKRAIEKFVVELQRKAQKTMLR